MNDQRTQSSMDPGTQPATTNGAREIFISYNRRDLRKVRRIVKLLSPRLARRGYKVWFDESKITIGDLYRNKIRDAINRCTEALIFVGKNGLGPFQKEEELIQLLERHASEGIRISPIVFRGGLSRVPQELRSAVHYVQIDGFVTQADIKELVRHLQQSEGPLTLGSSAYVAAALIITLLAVLALYLLSRTPGEVVAVLGFKPENAIPDTDWVSAALTETAAEALRAGGEIPVMERLDAWELQNFEPRRTPGNLRLSGVEYLLSGTYRIEPLGRKGLVVKPVLLNLKTGEQLCSKPVEGRIDTLAELVPSLVACARRELGAQPFSEQDRPRLRGVFPLDSEATKPYFEGLSYSRIFALQAALRSFSKAAQLSPRHPAPHIGLALTWRAMGNTQRAQQEASTALKLLEGLDKNDLSERARCEFRALHAEAAEEWDQSIQYYQSLFETYGSTGAGIRLAEIQRESGESQQAISTLMKIRLTSPPLVAENPKIDLTIAQALLDQGKPDEALGFAQHAVRKSQAAQVDILAAAAERVEALAEIDRGSQDGLDRAEKLIASARMRFASAKDMYEVLVCDEILATILYRQGSNQKALEILSRCASGYHRMFGLSRDEARCRLTMSTILQDERQSARAEQLISEAIQILLAVGERAALRAAFNELGYLLFMKGDMPGAEEQFKKALRSSVQLGDQAVIATALTNLAEISQIVGPLSDAERKHTDAAWSLEENGNRSELAYSRFQLGKVFAAQDKTAAAHRELAQALRDQQRLKLRRDAALTNLARAELAISSGSASEAVTLAASAVGALEQEGSLDDQASAHAILAQALILAGDLAQAQDEIEQAVVWGKGSQDFRVPIQIATAQARVRARLQGPGAALRDLKEIIQQTANAGFAHYVLEARLALGEIAMSSGSVEEGRRELEALARDAAAPDRGFLQVARRARQLLDSHP